MSAPVNESTTKGDASVLRVAILGSGPSGSALACMLARQGAEVTLFEHGRRPELVVGESLVPAVIPMLRRLGIEEEIAAIGLLKPGASFVWSPTDRFSFTFARFAPAGPLMPTTSHGHDSTRFCSPTQSPRAPGSSAPAPAWSGQPGIPSSGSPRRP